MWRLWRFYFSFNEWDKGFKSKFYLSTHTVYSSHKVAWGVVIKCRGKLLEPWNPPPGFARFNFDTTVRYSSVTLAPLCSTVILHLSVASVTADIWVVLNSFAF